MTHRSFRHVKILACLFRVYPLGMTLGEISKLLNIPQTSTIQYITTLMKDGLVSREGTKGKYQYYITEEGKKYFVDWVMSNYLDKLVAYLKHRILAKLEGVVKDAEQ